MKTRALKEVGFKPFIGEDGEAVWVLAAMVVSDGMARELRPPQVAAALRKVSERAAAGAERLDPQTTAAEPVTA